MERIQQVLILTGISGSGKSTFAKAFCEENPNWLRINRDDIRKSLITGTLNDYWKREDAYKNRIETLVNEIVKTSIHHALDKGWNILIDNTHLKLTYINQLIKMVSAFRVEIRLKLMDIDVETAIKRDKNRPDVVGEVVIREQFERLQILKKNIDFQQVIIIQPKQSAMAMVQDESLPKCIIVDIDGTVAEKGNRSPFDWLRVGEDTPKLPIIRLVKVLKTVGYEVIFFSGRDGICQPQTLDWLCLHLEWQMTDFHLFMRTPNDSRKDSIIKKELFDAHIKDKYFVDFVIDDRNQVVDMWRQVLGLTCLQVDYGDF
jgi:predicted kinase